MTIQTIRGPGKTLIQGKFVSRNNGQVTVDVFGTLHKGIPANPLPYRAAGKAAGVGLATPPMPAADRANESWKRDLEKWMRALGEGGMK
jgi:hypothetical protein